MWILMTKTINLARDLDGSQMPPIGLLRQELFVDELQVKDSPLERRSGQREADEQKYASPTRSLSAHRR